MNNFWNIKNIYGQDVLININQITNIKFYLYYSDSKAELFEINFSNGEYERVSKQELDKLIKVLGVDYGKRR